MRKFKFKIHGVNYEVSVHEISSGIAEVEVNGTQFTIEIENQEVVKSVALLQNKTEKTGEVRKVKEMSINSPLPGSILRILVKKGEEVKAGQTLLVMESMKMENNIVANSDGVIKNIPVTVGQNVMQDDVLIEYEGYVLVQSAKAPKVGTAAPRPTSTSGSIPALNRIISPLPGSVFKIVAAEGSTVKKGDLLLILESMKMENNILSDRDGVIKKYHVKEGETVMQEGVLIEFES